jgi:hypothetical protein
MLKRLQASRYGDFRDGQLRTLQRRVRVWRMRIVQQLVYGSNEPAAQEDRMAALDNTQPVTAEPDGHGRVG